MKKGILVIAVSFIVTSVIIIGFSCATRKDGDIPEMDMSNNNYKTDTFEPIQEEQEPVEESEPEVADEDELQDADEDELQDYGNGYREISRTVDESGMAWHTIADEDGNEYYVPQEKNRPYIENGCGSHLGVTVLGIEFLPPLDYDPFVEYVVPLFNEQGIEDVTEINCWSEKGDNVFEFMILGEDVRVDVDITPYIITYEEWYEKYEDVM